MNPGREGFKVNENFNVKIRKFFFFLILNPSLRYHNFILSFWLKLKKAREVIFFYKLLRIFWLYKLLIVIFLFLSWF